MNAIEFVPPQNLQAETSILGGILMQNEAIYPALENLRGAEDFYRESHRKIFRAMAQLIESREPVDLVILSEFLKARGELEAVGGSSYLAGLTDQVPSAANIAHYARIVREKAMARDLLSSFQELQRRIVEGDGDAIEIAAAASCALARIQDGGQKGFVSLCDVLVRTLKEIEKACEAKGPISSVPTGFIDIDSKVGGNYRNELTVIAARPSMGKTALAGDMALNAAKRGYTVAFVTLEMTDEMIARRFLAAEAMLENRNLRRGNIADHEIKRIVDRAAAISEKPLWFLDTDEPWDRIKPKIRALNLRHKIDAVFIDYTQLVDAGEHGNGRFIERRDQEVGRITRESKQMAKEMGAAFVLLSQLNRKCEERQDKRPQKSDLRESGEIEQHADVIAFIYRDVVYNPNTKEPTLAEYIVDKNRNGPIGTVKLRFLEAQVTFSDWQEAELFDHQQERD